MNNLRDFGQKQGKMIGVVNLSLRKDEKVNNLAVEVTNIVNKYIDEKGLTTEDVCGVLDVVSYKVKQASYPVDEPAEAKGGGGSPVTLEEN